MVGKVNLASGYLKLKKNQVPLENITRSELNQSVAVSEFHVKKGDEFEYPFQERFRGPAKEPWSTGILECAQDLESCLMGLFCPCVLFGRNVEQMRECTWIAPCICHAMFVEGGLALAAATAALHGFIDPGTAGCICEVLLSGWIVSGLCTGTVRESLEDKYLLERWPCDACLVHSYLHWCAICQEHRELKARLKDDAETPMAIVSPPPVQEMSASEQLTSKRRNARSV